MGFLNTSDLDVVEQKYILFIQILKNSIHEMLIEHKVLLKVATVRNKSEWVFEGYAHVGKGCVFASVAHTNKKYYMLKGNDGGRELCKEIPERINKK